MLAFNHALGGADVLTGTFALSLFVAGAVLALLLAVAALAFRHAGQGGLRGTLWRGALLLIGAAIALALLDRSSLREQAAERRALEARAVELISRAVAPGSPLACLEPLASVAIEEACEKLLFASPAAIAAAIAYVDAKLSLLGASLEYAAHDRGYEATLARLRRGIEDDRFGIVAHVLKGRGCTSADCPDLKLLRDPRRVLAHLKERTFEANVALHAGGWAGAGAGSAAASLPAGFLTRTPSATTGAASSSPATSRYDFPSAASIPPVSIMNAEPPAPPGPEPSASAASSPRAAVQAPRRPPPPREPVAAPPQPPLAVVPSAAAPPPQTR